MKWSNFQKFAAEHLELGFCLDWHINSRMRNMSLEEFVEQYVKYIAIRPWEKLDMNLPSTETLDEWWVHWRIQGDTGVRLSPALERDKPGNTVADIFDRLRIWYLEWWAQQPGDHPMLLTAVVRRREEWADEYTLVSRSLDIYLPPDGYTI